MGVEPDSVQTDYDALEALEALKQFSDDQGYDHLSGTVNALARLFAVRTEGFQDLAMYGAKVTVYTKGEDDEIRSHKALVFEPGVGEAPTGQYWDPNRGEYTTPDDYPLGTVNVIRASGDDDLLDDYVSDIVVETSITPADDPRDPEAWSYTPGWG